MCLLSLCLILPRKKFSSTKPLYDLEKEKLNWSPLYSMKSISLYNWNTVSEIHLLVGFASSHSSALLATTSVKDCQRISAYYWEEVVEKSVATSRVDLQS